MKKYELLKTDVKTLSSGTTLYRIKALINIDKHNVKAGDLGGYIEKEENLDHNGNAWVYGNALVYGNARVYGNAQVFGDAWVSGNALVSGNAWVYGNAQVYGNARVYGDAWVFEDAWISKHGECVVINNQKNNITLTPNLITIGCLSWKNLEEFESNYKEKGRQNNYTEDEAEMTAELVRAVMKRIAKQEPKTIKINHDVREFEIDIEKAKELGILK